jgi:hypothetical protein
LHFAAPQGLVTLDPDNLHCCMRPRIGRSTANGTFELLHEDPWPVRPDPYLVWDTVAAAATAQGPASGAATETASGAASGARHLMVVR